MSKEKSKALYFMGIHKTIAVLIPKKRGEGYLKSPFGGHHINDYYKKFTDLNLKFVGDCFDIDGYLSISFGPNSWDDNYQLAINEVMNGIITVFDQCNGYEEIDSDKFFNILTK